jgi:hypothetical protein
MRASRQLNNLLLLRCSMRSGFAASTPQEPRSTTAELAVDKHGCAPNRVSREDHGTRLVRLDYRMSIRYMSKRPNATDPG